MTNNLDIVSRDRPISLWHAEGRTNASTGHRAQSPHIPALDGIRAIAIAAVVTFHAWPTLLPGGFSGVDVFFALSGFLITRQILHDLHIGTFSLKAFYIRRARRLLPAAVTCFIALTLAAGFILMPDAYWYLGRNLLASTLMYANVFLETTAGYFSAQSQEKPLLHTWSLAVEDQFYLTWPILLILAFTRRSRTALIALATIGVIASLTYSEITLRTHEHHAFYSLASRAWELLAGAALAIIGAAALRRPVRSLGCVLALATLAGSFILLNETVPYPGLGALAPTLATLILITCTLAGPNTLTPLLTAAPIVMLGRISYSLYLWHWPVLALATYYLERPLTASEAAVAVAASLALAYLSWRFVEQPFRHPHATRLRTDPAFILAALAATLLCIGAAMALKLGKGFPARYDADARAVLQQMVSGNPKRSGCDGYDHVFKNPEYCTYGRPLKPGQSYDMALFGDSLADHWTPLLALVAQQRKLAFRQVTNGGCPFFPGYAVPASPAAKQRECELYLHAARAFIDRNPNLKLAVVSVFWDKWVARYELANSRILDFPGAPPNATPRFEDVLDTMISLFKERGIKVLLVGPIPHFPVALPIRCVIAHLPATTASQACAIPFEAALTQMARANALLKRKEQAGVSTWLPGLDVCKADSCTLFEGGAFLYKDAAHFNAYGSRAMLPYAKIPELP